MISLLHILNGCLNLLETFNYRCWTKQSQLPMEILGYAKPAWSIAYMNLQALLPNS